MRDALRTWALKIFPPIFIQWIRRQMLPCQRKLMRLIYTLKKPSVFKKASSNLNSALAQMEMGDLLYKLGQLNEAIEYYEKAIAIAPDLFKAHVKLELSIRLSGGEKKEDSKGNVLFNHVTYDLQPPTLDKLVDCCQKMVEQFPDSQEANFKLGNALLAAKGGCNQAAYYFYQANKLKFKEARTKGDLGLIYMPALHRSGSGYVERALHHGLGLDYGTDISAHIGWYPDLLISFPSFALSLQPVPAAIISNHIPASRANLMALNLSVDRLFVHVRDPRQAVVSYVHYLQYLKRTNNIYALLEARLPENYFLFSLEDQISWQIEYSYLPVAVNWINSWVDAQNDPVFYPEILFTTHEQLVADNKGFFETILKFYDIDQSRFKFPAQPVFEKNTHMRKGSVDEFKQVFTTKQIEKASQMVPERLKKMFDWSK